jgi:hypothetical protein
MAIIRPTPNSSGVKEFPGDLTIKKEEETLRRPQLCLALV